jgi:glutathione S-transferase
VKLYQSVGPNPRVVLMYLAETGLSLPRQMVDIMKGENRQGEFAAKSPLAHTPLLELDDGSHIAESLAICEYLDETEGNNALTGATPKERAKTRMLCRIVDQQVVVPMTVAFRGAEGHALFKDRLACFPGAAEDLKQQAREGLKAIDRLIGEGPYLAGERFSLADILLFAFVEFGEMVGQAADPSLANLAAWRERVAARPSAAASADPKQGLEPAA